MLVFAIDDDGIEAIDHDDAREIIEAVMHGPTQKRRATHIVPANVFKCAAFKFIRFLTGDGKRLLWLENWTRNWRGPQNADLRPSNGPVVGPFPDRDAAIAYEIGWLSENM